MRDGNMVSKGKSEKNLRHLDGGTKSWMKGHTVRDMKKLAEDMESKGEDASDIEEVVNAFEELEQFVDDLEATNPPRKKGSAES